MNTAPVTQATRTVFATRSMLSSGFPTLVHSSHRRRRQQRVVDTADVFRLPVQDLAALLC